MTEKEEQEYIVKAKKERVEYHKYLERVKKFKKMNKRKRAQLKKQT
jgi:hypothetical protein